MAATTVFDEQFKAADTEVAQIIAANLGRGKPAVAVAARKLGNQTAASPQKHASAPQPTAGTSLAAPVVQ
ncbi:hypothetical protein D3C71_1949180 [compost metagenome]